MALRLIGLTHDYGAVRAVDDASLRVAPSELLCLLGPSGCGKSTLLRIAAGLEPIQRGEVRINGRAIAGPGRSLPPERRGVGLVFQDYALFPHMNVRDNVAFGLGSRAPAERRRRAEELLERLDLGALAAAYPHTLSGGQQQRVALARALAPSPRVMLLDEPFSGLDRRLRETVRDQTLHALRESGAACVMVTHDSEEAMYMADTVALMERGRIVQAGPPSDLYFAPANAFVAGFLGESNRIHVRVQGGRAVLPFGRVAAPGLADGASALVMIRPEGLRLSLRNPKTPPDIHVVESRFLGRSSYIHVTVDAAPARLHLHARMPGRVSYEPGTPVRISLDADLAYVFEGEARAPGAK